MASSEICSTKGSNNKGVIYINSWFQPGLHMHVGSCNANL